MADTNQNQNPQQGQPQSSNDITEGVVGFFRTISGTKTKIVYTNIFTGEIKVKSRGIFFNFPWKSRPVRISLDQHKIDTVCGRTTTLGTGGNTVGPEIDYDTDYFVKIVDPGKFMDVAYSTSPEQIKKNIGDILDQKIQDYIRSHEYDTLIRQSSIDFMDEIGKRTNTGAFPTGTLNQELLEHYGMEVSKITFKVRPPKELLEEATKAKQAELATKTAENERKRREIEAQADADVTRIKAAAVAEQERLKGEAIAKNIASWIAAGMTNEQIASQLVNHELVNGVNPNTIVLASSAVQQNGSVPGQNAAFDMTTMLQLFSKMLQQQQASQQQTVQQQPSQQQPVQQQQAPEDADWASQPDTEYLTAEDSAKLAAERKTTIVPGGRYHILHLNDEERTRYCVAADKGKTK